MFCTKCGSQLSAGTRFCGKCGAALNPATAPTPTYVPPPPPPVSTALSPPSALTPPGYNPPPPVYNQPPAYAPPPQPMYAPSGPQAPAPVPFAPPPHMGYPPQPQPAYAQAASQAPPFGGPMPSEMHWVVVLILTWFTFGLGGLIWGFKEAIFVKKVDPASKAVIMLAVALLVMVGQVILFFAASGLGSAEGMLAMTGLIILLNIVIAIFGLVAVFGMRSSLVRYYNTAEPIGLKLSGVMTFFFNILYFQYHFSRIAEWKKTGQLR